MMHLNQNIFVAFMKSTAGVCFDVSEVFYRFLTVSDFTLYVHIFHSFLNDTNTSSLSQKNVLEI